MMPTMRVDKGAISFVMNGANIMCAGFTSKGGSIDTPLEAGSLVVSWEDDFVGSLFLALLLIYSDDEFCLCLCSWHLMLFPALLALLVSRRTSANDFNSG